MNGSTAIFIAVALVLTGVMGATFARWERALSDWRKTLAAIPGLRKTTFGHFRRLAMFVGALILLFYMLIRRGG